jgi:hypothetical protein
MSKQLKHFDSRNKFSKVRERSEMVKLHLVAGSPVSSPVADGERGTEGSGPKQTGVKAGYSPSTFGKTTQ